jgi:hypothetical protein
LLFKKWGDICLILFLNELRALTLCCLQKKWLGFIAWWLVREFDSSMVVKRIDILFSKGRFYIILSFWFLRAWEVVLKVCLMFKFFVFEFFCVQCLKENVVLLRMSNVDASQLVPMKAQVATCILHNWMFKCLGFVVVKNGWLVDLLKLQVLQCIICKFEPASSNALTQRLIFLLWVLLCKLHMQNCLLKKNNLETRL